LEEDVKGLKEAIQALGAEKLQKLDPLIKGAIKGPDKYEGTAGLVRKFYGPIRGRPPESVDQISVGIVIDEMRKSKELREATTEFANGVETTEARTALTYWLELRAIHSVLSSWKVK
jgi:hypothetical protein